MSKEKRLTLNAEKRKVISDVFQDHFESNSKYQKQHTDAIQTYKDMRSIAKTKIEQLVRFHQPQEDVDTIRDMVNKYGDSGGNLYHDNCFHVQNSTPRMDTDYNGNPVEKFDDVHIEFKASKEFLTSYYRDELKSKGLDPDYDVRLGDNYEKRNPTYYNAETQINNYLGYGARNDASGQTSYHKDTWKEDFKLWVIGTSYCHSRMFATDEVEYNWFKSFEVAKENVILAHKNLFDHVDKKMQKLKLGLKSYRYFDQAKELADKLGVVLNESVLDAHSSMALSIYSPTNLADLLTDKEELTRDEKIAIAKQQLREQLN
tara:strand:+ start:215 stop:1165 length:951 start_codon:yes stop_codon:yes gene_type:complete